MSAIGGKETSHREGGGVDAPPPYQGLFNVPRVVAALSAVLAIFYLIDKLSHRLAFELLWRSEGFSPALFFAGPEANGGAARMVAPLFSHMLIHANLAHLLFNLLWFVVFGSPMALRLRSVWRFLFLFLLSGAAGALFFSLFHYRDPTILIGASGGVTGLLGGLVRFAFTAPSARGGQRLLPLTDRSVLSWSAVVILLNASVAVIGSGVGDANVAWQSHIGGYLFGLLFFPLFDRRQR